MTRLPDLLASFPSDVADRIRSLRQNLHANPELAFREEQTCRRLEREMSALEPTSMTRVAGTGIVVRIPGRDPDGPLIAIRGDIDAGNRGWCNRNPGNRRIGQRTSNFWRPR